MAIESADAQDDRHKMTSDGMWELTKGFRFEAAHALSGTTLGADSE